MTIVKEVAVYFAALAADCDGDGMVTLIIDAAECRRRGVLLTPFEDDAWGDGECAWEREIAAWSNVPAECIVGVAGA